MDDKIEKIKKIIQERMENNIHYYRTYVEKLSNPNCTDNKDIYLNLSVICLERYFELHDLYQQINKEC